ncbi:MAG: hypothetical protein M5U13_00965 [Thermoanaerobaculia bacterium]|nr:hypothetical protein [Thermoanaerobaculia bacterium]
MFAFVPVSAKYQPAGVVLEVPVFASVSKFSENGVPPLVMLTHWP